MSEISFEHNFYSRDSRNSIYFGLCAVIDRSTTKDWPSGGQIKDLPRPEMVTLP